MPEHYRGLFWKRFVEQLRTFQKHAGALSWNVLEIIRPKHKHYGPTNSLFATGVCSICTPLVTGWRYGRTKSENGKTRKVAESPKDAF